MPRRFAVILFADVVDYSLMMGEDEEATIGLIRRLRQTSLEPIIKEHGGEVLKRMGDGWIFAFATVASAIDAAKVVHDNLSSDPDIRLRMGMHMGDIVEDDADIYGAGINLAARLLTEAPPCGLMISDDVHHQLSAKQAEGFADAGTFNLKNISRPVQGFQWRARGEIVQRTAEDVPIIAVEAFSAAPKDEDTLEAAEDFRDQIIHGLSRRTGIRVLDASRENSMNATYALRGRLRYAPGKARGSLSLILNKDGSSIWTERYEQETDDIYGFCDEISAKANNDLRLFTNSLDHVRVAEILDENLSVSELRTRAAGLFYECSISAAERCVSILARARRLDPEDGMSLSMWADGVQLLASIRFEHFGKSTLEELKDAFDKAVEILPKSDYVFSTRSLFRVIVLRDRERGWSDAQRCYALNPSYPQAHLALACAHVLSNDLKSAVAEFDAATQQSNDPYWVYKTFHKSVAQFCGEDYSGTIETLRTLIDLKPSIRGFRKLLVLALKATGEDEEARREEESAMLLPDKPNIHVLEPPLPDTHLWLRDALAPKDLN